MYPLAQARERLMEARRMVADGVNPVEVKQNQQHEDEQEEHIVAFKEVGELYLTHLDDQVAINELSEAHYIRSERLLRLYATPALGDMAINEITFRDLRDVIVALNGAGKKETAIKMSTPDYSLTTAGLHPFSSKNHRYSQGIVAQVNE